MFSLIQRVIKTRDGKIYASEPSDFQDQGTLVIYKGFLNVFKYQIHTENIIEDYTTLSFLGCFCGILLLLGLCIGFLSITSSTFLTTAFNEDVVLINIKPPSLN